MRPRRKAPKIILACRCTSCHSRGDPCYLPPACPCRRSGRRSTFTYYGSKEKIMSYHVLSGRFAFFYGPQAQAPANFPTGSVAGSVWQPVANTAQPTYTVLVLEFDRGEVGATGVSDLSHFEGRVGSTANPNDLGDQKVVLVSNWEPGPTPGSIVPTDGGHMYCDPGL